MMVMSLQFYSLALPYDEIPFGITRGIISMLGWPVINSAWEKTLCSDSEHSLNVVVCVSVRVYVSVCVCVICVRVMACT